ncbi:hypothetical protein CONPUDRAFT_154361 [Coniophora puteana RWD-64-598 SS2]|uniref:BRO domain-containing protein 1 n=1 Tax=Coniophora puteana (strain RWD-64-598) TaxID=741705 RepID=A0A5M3MMQ8_CONPW|nr:uncharacterized protein CONPUDRAFT_154361 [Coniophora puteana RWD-64-598 SS2]EIW80326.1 hypothetical protein CONPUDRAFT_154361 [Coniophora puteana RWD-64-598 SS2]
MFNRSPMITLPKKSACPSLKCFGPLELLEFKFFGLRVSFPWNDAFTNKQTTHTTIAYEKASILFQIAATYMLIYIDKNLLHALSADLSHGVIKCLMGITIAQATEAFLEKAIGEKKPHTLIFKVASRASYLYTFLTDELKDLMGKGIFDRNWGTLTQIKSQHFGSSSQYHYDLVDDRAGILRDALVRFMLAESLAKEASRNVISFNTLPIHVSPMLPADAGNVILDCIKTQLTLCTERKNEATRANDLIYHLKRIKRCFP